MGCCDLRVVTPRLAVVPVGKMTNLRGPAPPYRKEEKLSQDTTLPASKPQVSELRCCGNQHELHEAYGAVNLDCCDLPIRTFDAFTRNLHDLADSGSAAARVLLCKVYWIPPFEIFETTRSRGHPRRRELHKERPWSRDGSAVNCALPN